MKIRENNKLKLLGKGLPSIVASFKKKSIADLKSSHFSAYFQNFP